MIRYENILLLCTSFVMSSFFIGVIWYMKNIYLISSKILKVQKKSILKCYFDIITILSIISICNFIFLLFIHIAIDISGIYKSNIVGLDDIGIYMIISFPFMMKYSRQDSHHRLYILLTLIRSFSISFIYPFLSLLFAVFIKVEDYDMVCIITKSLLTFILILLFIYINIQRDSLIFLCYAVIVMICSVLATMALSIDNVILQRSAYTIYCILLLLNPFILLNQYTLETEKTRNFLKSKSSKYIDSTILSDIQQISKHYTGLYNNRKVVCYYLNKSIDHIHNECLMRMTYVNSNFVVCYGFTMIKNRFYIILEDCEHNAYTLINKPTFNGSYTPSKLIYLSDCAKAIQYLHSIDSNCVYRNLTIHSFELSVDNFFKLRDLGSYFGSNIDTVMDDFMAPEYFRTFSSGVVLKQSLDIFSLATVFYEILFPKRSKSILIWSNTSNDEIEVRSKHPFIPEPLNDELSKLLIEMWSYNEEYRPSIHEIVTSLDVIMYTEFKHIIQDIIDYNTLYSGTELMNILVSNEICQSDMVKRICDMILRLNIIKYIPTLALNVSISIRDEETSSYSSNEYDLNGLIFNECHTYKIVKKDITSSIKDSDSYHNGSLWDCNSEIGIGSSSGSHSLYRESEI